MAGFCRRPPPCGAGDADSLRTIGRFDSSQPCSAMGLSNCESGIALWAGQDKSNLARKNRSSRIWAVQGPWRRDGVFQVFLLSTGSAPGSPRQTGQTLELGWLPKPSSRNRKILVLVRSGTWTPGQSRARICGRGCGGDGGHGEIIAGEGIANRARRDWELLQARSGGNRCDQTGLSQWALSPFTQITDVRRVRRDSSQPFDLAQMKPLPPERRCGTNSRSVDYKPRTQHRRQHKDTADRREGLQWQPARRLQMCPGGEAKNGNGN